LLYACEYLELAQKHAGLSGLTVAKLFDEYTKTLYKLDSSYRHFLLGYDKLGAFAKIIFIQQYQAFKPHKG
jgi:hypothetical protein